MAYVIMTTQKSEQGFLVVILSDNEYHPLQQIKWGNQWCRC